jgi:periplasmic divalent cation tolerance protein
MSPIFLVITTVSTQEQANALASEAITLGLAACAQVQAPCQSVYSWQGKVESALEYPIHFKTNEMRHQALRDFIDEKHSYDVPEIVSIQIDTVNAAYAAWVQKSLGE